MPSPVVAETVMDFYEALKAVAAGEKVRRQSWPTEDAMFMQGGFLHVRNATGVHKLLVSDGDLAGADWVVVRDN